MYACVKPTTTSSPIQLYSMAARLHYRPFTANSTIWVVLAILVLKQYAQGCTWRERTGRDVTERYSRSIEGMVEGE